MTRLAASVAAAVTIAAGSGVAIATTGGDDEQAVLDRAAQSLEVTPAQLRDALASAREAELDQAVQHGELTEEQAERLKQRMEESGRVLGGFHGGRHHAGRVLMGAREELASALGLSRAELRSAFAEGKTLGEIAEEQGKDVDEVRKAVRDAAVERLDQAVEDDNITQAQRDEMVERLDERLADLADFGGRPMSRGHHGPMGGGDGDTQGAVLRF